MWFSFSKLKLAKKVMLIFRCFREYALLKPLGQRVTPIKKEWAKRANACPLSSLFWEIRSLSSFSLLRNVIQLTIRKCKDNAFQRSVFNRTARIWQIWNTFPNDLEILLSYYNAIVVIAIAKVPTSKDFTYTRISKVTLHYLMLHRFEIHSALELSRTAFNAAA